MGKAVSKWDRMKRRQKSILNRRKKMNGIFEDGLSRQAAGFGHEQIVARVLQWGGSDCLDGGPASTAGRRRTPRRFAATNDDMAQGQSRSIKVNQGWRTTIWHLSEVRRVLVLVPGVSRRSTPGYCLASRRDAGRAKARGHGSSSIKVNQGWKLSRTTEYHEYDEWDLCAVLAVGDFT